MLTPEDYSVSSSDGFDTKSYDEGGWDGTFNVHRSRLYYNKSASRDRNAWSRGNRWFIQK